MGWFRKPVTAKVKPQDPPELPRTRSQRGKNQHSLTLTRGDFLLLLREVGYAVPDDAVIDRELPYIYYGVEPDAMKETLIHVSWATEIVR